MNPAGGQATSHRDQANVEEVRFVDGYDLDPGSDMGRHVAR